MAFGLTRLNERHQRPNKLINFIKPLDGPDKAMAQDFLERIAAIVYPVMKAYTITVMSLDEFPANREFVGRNFNAGECIQLVLKSPVTGQWLSFRSVQMVMMHELAHCKQMNHSRAFWAVRNSYADHLRMLWERDYRGEGVWGRGQTLLSGRFERDDLPDAAANGVESLCGGTYRGQRRGGRKRKRNVTYAERRDRRIERKFGRHGTGNALGEDYEVKATLEKGRRTEAKPRVANSKRGRELRAAAALARFAQAETASVCEAGGSSDAGTLRADDKDGDDDDDTQSESSDGEYDNDLDGLVLLDDKGEQVKDTHGNRLVRVCASEDMADDDENVKREMEELRTTDVSGRTRPGSRKVQPADPKSSPKILQPTQSSAPISINGDDQETESEDDDQRSIMTNPVSAASTSTATAKPASSSSSNKKTAPTELASKAAPRPTIKSNPPLEPSRPSNPIGTITITTTKTTTTTPSQPLDQSEEAPRPVSSAVSPRTCEICSLENEAGAFTCLACSHVLDAHATGAHTSSSSSSSWWWKCTSSKCDSDVYRNADDCGICGLCGSAKRTW